GPRLVDADGHCRDGPVGVGGGGSDQPLRTRPAVVQGAPGRSPRRARITAEVSGVATAPFYFPALWRHSKSAEVTPWPTHSSSSTPAHPASSSRPSSTAPPRDPCSAGSWKGSRPGRASWPATATASPSRNPTGP